jgi:hypothetical protein
MKTKIGFILSLICLTSSLFASVGAEDLIQKLAESKIVVDKHAKWVDESVKASKPLSGMELLEISEGAKDRILTRKEAYDYFSKDFNLVKKPIRKNRFTISDENLKSMIGSLAVAVTLYETTLHTYHMFQDRPKLRRLLNEKDSSFNREDDTFKDSLKSLFSVKNSLHLLRAIKIYKRFYLTRPDLMAISQLQKFSRIIEASYLYNHFRNHNENSGLGKDVFLIVLTRLKVSFQAKVDFFNFMANSIVYNGSKLFGNIVGGFQKRRGILYQDQEFISKVQNTMKPMDILLEKTPFRMTDRFIPGYWGHAAIYIGSESDLKRLGIWEHELVQKFAEEISEGNFIVEALRNKVQMNTIEHFSDIDDFALLRHKEEMSDEETAEHILRALSHVGKKYDFSFDVESGDTIVCSELHYRTFVNLKFNTTFYLGRSTISVDQVAEQSIAGMPLSPVLLYVNGEEITEDVQEEYDQLLKKPITNEDNIQDAA